LYLKIITAFYFGEYEGIRIVTAAEFVARFAEVEGGDKTY
jgi:hypothetical protein